MGPVWKKVVSVPSVKLKQTRLEKGGKTRLKMEAAAHQAQWKTQPDASPFLSRVVIYVGSRRQRGQDGVQILPDA